MQRGMKSKAKVLSFRIAEKIAKQLQKKDNYTVWIQQVILKAMGYCPVCGVFSKKEKKRK